MNAKEAIKLAKATVAEYFQEEKAEDVRLEEIELDEALRRWRVTISFAWPKQTRGRRVMPSLRGLTFSLSEIEALKSGKIVVELDRVFKVVEIDDANGEIKAVRERTYAAA